VKTVTIESLSNHVGEEVRIRGWLYNKRSSGKLRFLILRDGTGWVQSIMAKSDVPEEVFALFDELTQESSLEVTGEVREDPRAPGGVELGLAGIEPVQISQEYPITKKEHGTAFLLDHRHLWLRSRRPHAILRVRARVVRALRDFFDDRGFILVDSPILTPAACEGTSTLFETDYFGTPAYLSQSGQLYQEPACQAFGKTYTFGPTFRAEKSKTRRHVMEFWMLEPEVAWAGLEDMMDLSEEMICHVVGRILEECRPELETLERDTAVLESVQPPFPRITYDEAVERLKKAGQEFTWGGDFGGEDETVLAGQFDRPVIVHRFPAGIKAFYMERDPERPELALGLDVLAPEGYGEIVGGGERMASLEELEGQIEEHNLPREAFEWYLDVRRYGSVPHAGFGLGLERFVGWICGVSHIRETIPFPRLLHRIYP